MPAEAAPQSKRRTSQVVTARSGRLDGRGSPEAGVLPLILRRHARSVPLARPGTCRRARPSSSGALIAPEARRARDQAGGPTAVLRGDNRPDGPASSGRLSRSVTMS